jgi:hypothetical protein
VSNNEGTVAQIVALPETYTSMACYMNSTTAPQLTFTVKVNLVNTTLTCTIPAGQRSGTCSGCGSATVVAGDIFDVATPSTGTPSVAGSFALAP